MSKLRALIADDEEAGRKRLLQLLKRDKNVELVGIARNGEEAVELIRSASPEVLFLDIQMPLLDGFGVIREVTPEKMPVTIFVTAFDDHAIKAFEAQALDYLLKPFSDERFEAAMERARKSLKSNKEGEIHSRLASLMARVDEQPGYLTRFVLKEGGRVRFLDADEIEWVEGAGVYVHLHAGAKSYLYRGTLGEIYQKLNPKHFVRIHKSAVVNTTAIGELQPKSHGEYLLILKSGTELTLSRVFRPQFEQWLGQSL